MMWRLRLALVAPLAAAPAGAQSVDLIEERLTDVRSGFFELGPFYATPALRFSGGYDSNALSTPEAQADIAALLGPGIRLALPMGSNAFFDMFQEVDFVYYKNNVDLRRIFDITRLGGGWGGRRFLLQINNEFRDETRRPTTEFDTPVEMRTNQFEASTTFAFGWRHQLSARYDQTRSKIVEAVIDDSAILDRLNYVRDSVSVDFSRRVSAKTNALTQVFYERLSIDDPTRDSDSYGMRAGFDFSPTLSSGSIRALESFRGHFRATPSWFSPTHPRECEPRRICGPHRFGGRGVCFGCGASAVGNLFPRRGDVHSRRELLLHRAALRRFFPVAAPSAVLDRARRQKRPERIPLA